MANCLKIVVTEPDADYLGIEIFASSSRFAGATKIYAGLDDLTRLAEAIAGFPTSRDDERRYVLGTKDKGFAGGYCALRLYCRDGAGHASIEVELADDDTWYSEASARFTLPVLAAEIDDFVRDLRLIEEARLGEAELESKG